MSMIKLADRDHAVLRQFEGRSSIDTFLTVVIARVCQDYLDKLRGKYRPSAAAKKLGQIAIWLEMYMNRDHQPFEEACETLRSKHGVTLSQFELEQLAEQLPVRFRRRVEGEAALAGIPGTDGADDLILQAEKEQFRERLWAIIDETVKTWPPEDVVIFRMRFSDGLTVADIARIRGLDQKPLYRRFDEMVDKLRTTLRDAGIDDVGDLLD
jgi:RNA polymerase sigma factor (sigma-70 family)